MVSLFHSNVLEDEGPPQVAVPEEEQNENEPPKHGFAKWFGVKAREKPPNPEPVPSAKEDGEGPDEAKQKASPDAGSPAVAIEFGVSQKSSQIGHADAASSTVAIKTLPPSELEESIKNLTLAYDRYATIYDYRFNWIRCDGEFRDLLKEVNEAIAAGSLPDRIARGSSGSYFVKDIKGRHVGVFKPMNEEPYGSLNPKWTKWAHKTCFPCFFGRSCLIPNVGFISEVAASTVDRHLGLNIVPRTEIVELSSSSFHYGYWARRRAARDNTDLPRKIGSFQLFVEGFIDAKVVCTKMNELRDQVPDSLHKAFQLEFERLVILDYIIRNTDRSMDNWMVHISWVGASSSSRQNAPLKKTAAVLAEENLRNLLVPPSTFDKQPVVKIAGIDNGLAFPINHPNNWRSYPYAWATLPQARHPFSHQSRAEFLPILTDPTSWDDLIAKLYNIFRRMDANFDVALFSQQTAIIRGQMHNVTECLQLGQSPLDLLRKPLVQIEVSDLDDDAAIHSANIFGTFDHPNGPPPSSRRYSRRHWKTFVNPTPCFSWC